MIEVKDAKLHTSPKAASISFTTEYRDEEGRLQMRIKGCRVISGYIYGPSRRLATGAYTPQVEFAGGLRVAIVEAVAKAGWSRDYPEVQFPGSGSSEPEGT